MKTLFFFIVLASSIANAASILQIKGNKALLDISDTLDMNVGSEYFGLNSEGKRKVLLKITQVKNNKAIAEITKGTAEVGMSLAPRTPTLNQNISRPVTESDVNTSAPEEENEETQQYVRQLKKPTGSSWGLLGSLLQTNMSVDISGGAGFTARKSTASLKGTTFGFAGYYDYAFNPQFQLRAMASYDQVKGTGSIAFADCNGSTDCDFNFTYLTLSGIAKYNYFSTRSLRGWLGGGYSFMVAMGKSSNAVDTGQSTGQMFSVETGIDVLLRRNSYIPFSLHYGMFPSSDTVKANVMIFRIGYGFNL